MITAMANYCECIDHTGHCPYWGVCPHSYGWGDPVCFINTSKEEWEGNNRWSEVMLQLEVRTTMWKLENQIEKIKETNDWLDRTSYF